MIDTETKLILERRNNITINEILNGILHFECNSCKNKNNWPLKKYYSLKCINNCQDILKICNLCGLSKKNLKSNICKKCKSKNKNFENLQNTRKDLTIETAKDYTKSMWKWNIKATCKKCNEQFELKNINQKCPNCIKQKKEKQKLETLLKNVKAKNFSFIEIINNTKVKMRCNTCQNISVKNITSIHSIKCLSCFPRRNRSIKKYENAKALCEQLGLKLLSTFENFYSSKLELECELCNFRFVKDIKNLRRNIKQGVYCPNCGSDEEEWNVRGIIYKATCTQNGKVYVGQTIQPLGSRRREHFRYARNDTSNNKFSNALKKYGKENFEWIILHKNILWSELDSFEIKEIRLHDSYSNGYNSTEGGSLGTSNALKTKTRTKAKLKKQQEREEKIKKIQEQKRLTQFKKDASKEIKDFLRQQKKAIDLEAKKMQETINRSLGGKQKYKEKKPKESKYIGVCLSKTAGANAKKWKANIKHEGRKIHLGCFETETEAARAYDRKCIELRGDKAKTNF